MSNNERDSIRDRPRFKAARAQKVGCSEMPGYAALANLTKQNLRGEGIKPATKRCRPGCEAPFSYVGGDQHREG